jgi:hypothetical protein
VEIIHMHSPLGGALLTTGVSDATMMETFAARAWGSPCRLV